LSAPVLLKPLYRFVLKNRYFGWRPRLARRASCNRPGVVFDRQSHLLNCLVAILFYVASPFLFIAQPLSYDLVTYFLSVEGQSEAYFRPWGGSALAVSVWSRASLWHIGLAGRLDAGVSRSASLLAAI
jgi:hypothetical protein